MTEKLLKFVRSHGIKSAWSTADGKIAIEMFNGSSSSDPDETILTVCDPTLKAVKAVLGY